MGLLVQDTHMPTGSTILCACVDAYYSTQICRPIHIWIRIIDTHTYIWMNTLGYEPNNFIRLKKTMYCNPRKQKVKLSQKRR